MTETKFNIFTHQQRGLAVLLGWAVGSMVAGWVWLRAGGRFWRGMGEQFIGWGLIDGLLAVAGLRSAVRKAPQLARGEITPTEAESEQRNFQRILWFNAGLDILYILSGLWLVQRFNNQPHLRGTGLGVALQGAFLLVFDVLLALRTRRQTT